MRVARFITILLLLLSVFFMPYWFYFPALFGAIFFWPFFWEAVVIVLLTEFIYGVGGGIFHTLLQPIVWCVFLAVLFMAPIKDRLRTYA